MKIIDYIMQSFLHHLEYQESEIKINDIKKSISKKNLKKNN